MPAFPSQAWMQAYADEVAGHGRAAELSAALVGRYRFVITGGGGFNDQQAHDLIVESSGRVSAAPADYHVAAVLTVTADYPRWKGLISGTADFMMSFLMRRISVEGNVMGMRDRISDVAPLLECLKQVPTSFEY